MKFSFWSGFHKRREMDPTTVVLSAPPIPQATPLTRRTLPAPIPVPVNPVIQEMQFTLANLVYRVTETIAKTELYFPASDLRLLGIPTDSPALCAEADHRSRELLLRAEIKHGERYVTQTAEIITALHTAERAALLLRLLCADSANAAALPVLRRVADACERVIRHSAKVLEAPAADVFTWSNSVVAGQNEAQTAVHKAITLLGRTPSILSPSAEKMARTAIWSMEIAAETTAHAALECRGVILPATVELAETKRETRYVSSLPRVAFAHMS